MTEHFCEIDYLTKFFSHTVNVAFLKQRLVVVVVVLLLLLLLPFLIFFTKLKELVGQCMKQGLIMPMQLPFSAYRSTYWLDACAFDLMLWNVKLCNGYYVHCACSLF